MAAEPHDLPEQTGVSAENRLVILSALSGYLVARQVAVEILWLTAEIGRMLTALGQQLRISKPSRL